MVQELERGSDGIALRWKREGKVDRTEVTINLSLPNGDRGVKTKIAARMQILLQADHDIVIRRSDLPSDEPDKTIDPARANQFWRDGNVVYRSDVITVIWNGDSYVPTVSVAGAGPL